MPDGIPRVRGEAIAREISQIGAPESPARRGGAGVLEALRETFALSPAAREIKIRRIGREQERQAVERQRQLPVGAGASAALGLLFQGALAAQGVEPQEAARQARESTEGLTRGQIETVTNSLGLLLRRNPQGANQALGRSLTLRGQLAQQVSRLDDDIEIAGKLVGEAFTAEGEERRQRLIRERAELKTSLDAFDRLINGLFGIGGAQPQRQPVRGRVQVQQPPPPPPGPTPGVPPSPPATARAEQEFLGGL